MNRRNFFKNIGATLAGAILFPGVVIKAISAQPGFNIKKINERIKFIHQDPLTTMECFKRNIKREWPIKQARKIYQKNNNLEFKVSSILVFDHSQLILDVQKNHPVLLNDDVIIFFPGPIKIKPIMVRVVNVLKNNRIECYTKKYWRDQDLVEKIIDYGKLIKGKFVQEVRFGNPELKTPVYVILNKTLQAVVYGRIY